MPNQATLQDQSDLSDSLHLTPTDIAQYLRLGECFRYLKLRMHERKHGSGFLREFGVAPQPIPPLLTLAGQEFESHVEAQARERFRVVNCAVDKGADGMEPEGEYPPNGLVAGFAASLPAGDTLLLFQPRVEALISDWAFSGDLDILWLHRDHQERLHVLIVDMKATRQVKVEHRLQVAFYRQMIGSIFAEAGITHEPIRLGVLYRGPQQEETPTDMQQTECDAAQKLLGVGSAFLELIPEDAVENYQHEIADLVTGPEAVAARVTHVHLAEAPFHLSLKCDGCLYNEYCMKDACLRADLSLVPTLTAREKASLLAHGIADIYDLGGLMRFAKEGEEASMTSLVVKAKHAGLVKTLQATTLGPRLVELVHRARAVVAAREREQARTQARRGEAITDEVQEAEA